MNKAMKARKKPVIIEFIIWTGENLCEVVGFVSNRDCKLINGKLCISTLEGDMVANLGDYIIKGVKSECYPCKPDIFKMTYEVLEE